MLGGRRTACRLGRRLAGRDLVRKWKRRVLPVAGLETETVLARGEGELGLGRAVGKVDVRLVGREAGSAPVPWITLHAWRF